MRSTKRTPRRDPRNIGRSIFANLSLVGIMMMLANLGHMASESTRFTAGPLDDTWDYLVELYRLLMGL